MNPYGALTQDLTSLISGDIPNILLTPKLGWSCVMGWFKLLPSVWLQVHMMYVLVHLSCTFHGWAAQQYEQGMEGRQLPLDLHSPYFGWVS